jgi:uncharacterized protein (TIGR00730 family)
VNHFNRICVFCGSSSGRREEYRAAAELTGRTLAQRGIGLVYGGGRVGLMGAMADAALAAGGQVIGVIPDVLMAKEVGHHGLTEMHVVRNLHERKAMMADLSDAFLALPGGFGTFEEFCEVITWSQLSLHKKPCGMLNVAGYWNPLAEMFDHSVAEGFLKSQNRGIVLMDEDIDALLHAMSVWVPNEEEKWIRNSDR